MKKIVVMALACFLVSGAEPPHKWEITMKRKQIKELPTAEAGGEYTRSTASDHPFWLVVTDGGLRGRESNRPHLFQGEKARVLRVFRAGSILNSSPPKDTQTGIQVVSDAKGQNWLMVLTGNPSEPDEICYVRANRNYIRPVHASE